MDALLPEGMLLCVDIKKETSIKAAAPIESLAISLDTDAHRIG